MQHFRAQETCKVRQAPSASSRVDGSKMRLLKQRGKTTTTEEEKWYSMYRIIFPDDPSFPSPYYELEEKGNALPSKAVAQRMFRENLDERFSTWDLGDTPGIRGLQDPELMNLIISGATAAFDNTFTAMCNQNAKQTLDNPPAVIARPASETQDDGQWHRRLMTDLDRTGQTSSQVREITELPLDEVSNPGFQFGLEVDLYTEICSLETDPSNDILFWDQPQQQQQARFHPEPGHRESNTETYDCILCGVSFKTRDLLLIHVCIPAPPGQGSSAESVSTSLQRQVHTGFNFGPPTRNDMSEVGDGGNALDRDLVTDNSNGNRKQNRGSPEAALQSLGTAIATSNDEQSQDLRLWHDDFAHLLFQNDPNSGGSNWY
ncbi:uncharacterized protein FIESC28_02784 [Fusarium coffeatum]|uniref:C2H2-type domain-containing protein n=1 Tax=Fusarium coffeatum TaxID=231269 RepID=A0A366S4Q0_9HYPO|nr:uncharacterized protein FIESC28_02784 [Fusarium coffeatum]RBR24294.1 hypothetical protein FIESC28_02784 [Fusarium coffeatum]